MSLSEIGIIVSLLQGAVSLLGLVYALGVKFTRLEVKVDTMWDFQMRRAVTEGVRKGVIKMNSPISITDKARASMENLTSDLRQFYSTFYGRSIPERDLWVAIEREYGDRILREVCIPNGLDHGACIIIALAVAREEADH